MHPTKTLKMLPTSILSLSLLFCISGVSSQSLITFSSFHENTGRMYGCPGEILLYICNGTGNEIDVYAPPYIPSRSRLSFTKGDAVGSGLGSGSIGLFLLSTEGDYISAGVMVRESDLEECVITCEVHSNTESINDTVVHRPSESPLEVTSPTITYLGSLNEGDHSVVRVSWNANAGNYDLRHYTVTIYSSDNDEIESANVVSKGDIVSVMLPVPITVQVPIYAKITTTSFCSITNNGVTTNSVYISPSSATGMEPSQYITILLPILTIIIILLFESIACYS